MQKELEAKQKEEELTPEQQEEMEKLIPDWKKGALVLTDAAQQEEEKAGILKKLRS